MKRGGSLLVDWVNGYISCYWLKHTLSFTMPRLQNVFSHLLPILDEPTSYIPMLNSTILDDPINTTFLHNILGDANRTLVDDPLPPPSPDLSDDEDATDSSIVLSALTFYAGRCRGKAARTGSSILSTRPRGIMGTATGNNDSSTPTARAVSSLSARTP